MSNYQRALDWLYSFIDSERKLPATPLEFNLPRVTALLELLGNPQQQYPSVVVAGSKGKGSTCAMLESIIRAAGVKTGLFTSPHLHSYRERMQVNRTLPSHKQLVALVEQVKPLVGYLNPALGKLTTYELGVALGLSYFAEQQIEFVVLEIGLGGRYDAINTVTPLVSIITSISLEHTAVLGTTLGAIAGEKAGIIKPGVPIITTVQPAEAGAVIAQRAADQQAPLFIATLSGLREEATGEHAAYPLEIVPAALGLRGDFQMANAQLATGAALLLREMGLPLADDAIRAGLAQVQWPGRLETLREQPLLVVDGAHNGDSARVLLHSLRQNFRFKRLILVLGVMYDKDIAAIGATLVPPADLVILTQSQHPRALPVAELQSAIESYSQQPIYTTSDIPPAITQALALAEPDDLICVTGSLYVVAAAREALGIAESD